MTIKLYHSICRYLRDVTSGTKWEGHIFAVGGCVRDSIRQAEITDIDLAVDTPNGGIEFARWLRKKHLVSGRITEFEKYGTAMLTLRKFKSIEIELVQTRKEKYTDRNSRNPETAFGSLEDDCLRRDLTVNSLYYDILNDRIIDITGRGIRDIQNQILATPLNPDITFDDDPVRILRTIRFANRFEWEIEPATFEAMLRNIDRLTVVSRERNRSELIKMLEANGSAPLRALSQLRHTGALKYMLEAIAAETSLPSVDAPGSTRLQNGISIFERIPELDERLSHEFLPPMFMAAMLIENGREAAKITDRNGQIRYPRYELRSAKQSGPILRRMRFERSFIDHVAYLILNQNNTPKSEFEIRRLQFECNSEKWFIAVLHFIKAVHPDFDIDNAITISDKLRKSSTDLFGKQLPISDDEISRITSEHRLRRLSQYRDFLINAICEDPHRSLEELTFMLRNHTPGRQHSKKEIEALNKQLSGMRKSHRTRNRHHS